jgi:hypothetical protein
MDARLLTGRLSDFTDDADDGKKGNDNITGGYEGRSSDSQGWMDSSSVWVEAASKVKESNGRASFLCVAGSASSFESLAGKSASDISKTERIPLLREQTLQKLTPVDQVRRWKTGRRQEESVTLFPLAGPGLGKHLVDSLLFYVLLKNISFIWRCHFHR